ncbi:MAG: glutamine-hydrolyzing carbamoyl-phosphate synthase small subunit [Candidatus Micrarchaeota archaeon]
MSRLSPKSPSKYDSILALADGTSYMGSHFGAEKESLGELVFNTSMSGYQEALTDPSYAGQILTFCYPLQGNYGTNKTDFESEKVHVRAVVASEICGDESYSHYSANRSYSQYLKENDVPGIAGVDTRAIVRKVREHGVMPAAISLLDKGASEKERADLILELQEKLSTYKYGEINFVKEVSTKKIQAFSPPKISKRIALIDCGVKMSIIREMVGRNVEVVAYPFDVSPQTLLKEKFDGVLVSNGPGDPALMKGTISTVKTLIPKLPLFGICLGHQIISHALGGTTYKLKFGHRGSNHAVLNPETGKVYITTQNHGFAAKEVPSKIADTLFINCNDGTNEGLRHKDLPVISAQFHPEGACGPKDANFLFDEFVKMMG